MDGDLDARVEKRGGRKEGERERAAASIITTTSEVLGERASCGRVRFFQLPTSPLVSHLRHLPRAAAASTAATATATAVMKSCTC
ncbi:hypothetical protein ZWY2020_001603 [Hordeum vulgare]|nr:hypothetical protein ZWY2020_001603 [Hordeum vulgare]